MALTPHPTIPPLEDGKPVLVLINDGWGVNTEDQYNAVFSAETPVDDGLAGVPGRFRTVRVSLIGEVEPACRPAPWWITQVDGYAPALAARAERGIDGAHGLCSLHSRRRQFG